jgi:uncharacterized protein YbjT (DUF2867 family)
MTILVTGATGKAGRQVVTHLLARGQQVRALTRDPAKAAFPRQVEVHKGDLTEPGTLDLTGVTGIHLITVGGDDYATLRTGPRIAELAGKAGVTKVSVLWNGSPGPVEEALAASGLACTWIEPVDFMGNSHHWAPEIREHGRVSEPFGDSRNAVVHEADIGAVVAAVLTEDGHEGRAYSLTGPEALTPKDKLRIIGETIGRELEFAELTGQQARDRWRAMGTSTEMIDILVAWQENPPPAAYTVVHTVERLTGRPPRTFRQWAAENAEAFRS